MAGIPQMAVLCLLYIRPPCNPRTSATGPKPDRYAPSQPGTSASRTAHEALAYETEIASCRSGLNEIIGRDTPECTESDDAFNQSADERMVRQRSTDRS